MIDRKKLIFQISVISIFAALEFVCTSFIAIPLSGGGYLNFSDLFVFLLACIINPIIGGLVGGISACLSDLYLGYAFYIPFTFVIKFLEGLIAGYLYRLFCKNDKNSKVNVFLTFLAFFIGGIFMAFLYMIPDYLQYIYVPNTQIPTNLVSILFLNFSFNLIQGTVNAILACFIFTFLKQPLKTM